MTSKTGHNGAVSAVTRSETINANPQACFDALIDFESYPSWQSAVSTAMIRASDDTRGTVDVDFSVDLRIRKVRYALRYHLDGPSSLKWELIDGDIRRVDGGYDLVEVSPGVTEASYTLDIDPGFPVPGLVRRRLISGSMSESVRELKQRVEG